MNGAVKPILIIFKICITLTVLISLISPAAGHTAYTVLTIPSVRDNTTANLGTVLINTTAGAVGIGSAGTVSFRLPADFNFDWASVTTDTYGFVEQEDLSFFVNIPSMYSGEDNGLSGITYTIQKIADNEIILRITSIANASNIAIKDGYMYLYLKNVFVPPGFSGEVNLMANASSSSGFGSGSVVVAKVSGPGEVTISIYDIKSFSSNMVELGKICVTENIPGALINSSGSLEFKLSSGFTWDIAKVSTSLMWGDIKIVPAPEHFILTDNGSTLLVTIPNVSEQATSFSINDLKINIDLSKLKGPGPVICEVKGLSSVNPDSLVVAKYFPISSTDPPNGATDVPINKKITIVFSENIQAGNNIENITLSKNSDQVQFSYNINGATLTLCPTDSLEYSVTYTVYIPSGAIRDIGGINLSSNYSFSFTTTSGGGGHGNGSSGGGGNSGSSNLSKIEEVIKPGTSTFIEIPGKVKVEIPDSVVAGRNASVVAELLSDKKADNAGATLLSRVVDITIKNGKITGKIPITLFFDKNKLSKDQKPAVFYYDEKNNKWVQIDGFVDTKKGTVTVMVDHLTTFAVFALPEESPKPITSFNDTNGHWAEQSINKLAKLRILNGYPDGTFKPDKEISRAEMTIIIMRILELNSTGKHIPQTSTPSASEALQFTDKIPDWAREAINKGVVNGIVGGYPDGTFKAEKNITRAEAASMLSRLLEGIYVK